MKFLGFLPSHRKSNASRWAMLVTMLFLLPAFLYAAGSEEPKRKENTLVTGVVVSRSDYLIKDQIPVRIYKNGIPIAEIIPENGMFVLDLKGLADQDDQIEVVIWPERVNRFDRHSGKSIRTNLAHAQNLKLSIAYVSGRSYGHGRTLYINNI
jgi:hypothetical protein